MEEMISACVMCFTDLSMFAFAMTFTTLASSIGENTSIVCADILAVHHTAGNMIILEAYALLKVRHDLVQKTAVYGLTSFCNDLTRIDVYQTFCQTLIEETVLNMKLLVDLVATNVSQIITLRIEETGNEKALRILQCWRLARTKTFIDFDERFSVESVLSLSSVF